MKLSTLILFVGLILAGGNLYAGIIQVPGDTTSIQGAIDRAVDGDTVLVAEGAYVENIRFYGKAITVASHFLMDGNKNHIIKTVIDGSQPAHPDTGSVVFMVDGEDTTSVLCGFTITGGTGTLSEYKGEQYFGGGGVVINESGGKIVHNKIVNNHINRESPRYCYSGGIDVYALKPVIIRNNEIAWNSVNVTYGGGGGVTLGGDAPIVFQANYLHHNTFVATEHAHGGGLIVFGANSGLTGEIRVLQNTIVYNTAQGAAYYSYGGGVYSEGPKLLMVGNVIAYNEAAQGGGFCSLYLESFSTRPDAILINNAICENSAFTGGALFVDNSSLCIMNSIIWDNQSDYSVIRDGSGGRLKIHYSDVQGGCEKGCENFAEDPLMKKRDITEERGIPLYCSLEDASPCIDAGPDHSYFNDCAEHLQGDVPLACGSARCDVGAYGGKKDYAELTELKDMIRVVGIGDETPAQPLAFGLAQNYPNPFNPSTTITFTLPQSELVNVEVFNTLGQSAEVLVDGFFRAGVHKVRFDAGQHPSGIYFYRITAGEFQQVRKMVLLK